MLVLVLNAGSSSQKSCLYGLGNSIPDTPPKPLWEAHLDWTVSDKPGILKVKSNGIKQTVEVTDKDTALKTLLATLTQGEIKVLESLNDIDAIGHRVVHGGAKYSQPILIDDEVKGALKD